MSFEEVATTVLLAIGVAGFAITSIGLVISDDVYDQIHFLAPGTLAGSLAIPAAVLLHEGLSQAGAKAILIGVLLFISNPVLSHATGRAARIRRKNQLALEPEESIPAAGEKE